MVLLVVNVKFFYDLPVSPGPRKIILFLFMELLELLLFKFENSLKTTLSEEVDSNQLILTKRDLIC
jgi:hypothetical protein